jgi:hypothetical protein
VAPSKMSLTNEFTMAVVWLEIPISGVVGALFIERRLGGADAGALLAVEAGLGAISTSWVARWQGGLELITALDS